MKTKACNSSDEFSLKICMEYNGEKPINVFKINERYIIAIYAGKISKYDIIIRYRQKDLETNEWSSIRQPKHIHWTVDMLMKLQADRELTKKFLNFLLNMWNSIEPIKNEDEIVERTSYEYIAEKYETELNNYLELSQHGEYSVKFLVFLACLLMTQEKTNRKDAYMFGRLLEALKQGEQIYRIVSIATHNRKRRKR